MNHIRNYVSSLMPREVLRLIEDYETFERMGYIGDCALRRAAESLSPHCGSVVLVMRDVAFEAYRNVAYGRLAEVRDKNYD